MDRADLPAPLRSDEAGLAPGDFLALHSRTFHLASRLFPAGPRSKIERLYAYCRVTDDLADGPGDVSMSERESWLTAWLDLSRRAYDGEEIGLPVLDGAMRDMASADVPFDFASELIEGMRMDLRHSGFRTKAELDFYCYRVASVVGLWITHLFGIDDPLLLRRAAALGRGMQLTNIVRDVGEDWRRGRLYLPTALLARHGLDADAVGRLVEGERPLPSGYGAVLEALMVEAEADYRAAMAVLPRLPAFYRRPVAVAARVYRGLHDEVRRSGYENLDRRNRVGRGRAWSLAAQGLLALSLEARRWLPVDPCLPSLAGAPNSAADG